MNEVTNFGFYMFNKWNQEECMRVFWRMARQACLGKVHTIPAWELRQAFLLHEP